MIHLSAPWMNGVPLHMGVIQNFLLQRFFVGHYQSSPLNMTHAFISLLSTYDLVPQGRCGGDVEQ
jgi:hypothetical protein